MCNRVHEILLQQHLKFKLGAYAVHNDNDCFGSGIILLLSFFTLYTTMYTNKMHSHSMFLCSEVPLQHCTPKTFISEMKYMILQKI